MSGYVIVLTGGIAAGKSAVERRFAALGVGVYDADRAAREVVVPGSEGLAAIRAAFGTEALDEHGALDRAAMRRRVFADPAARQTLEAIVHPRIGQWLHDKVSADAGPYCLLSVPLLAEHRARYDWADRVLLVDVPEATQIARLVARDGIDEELARRMLASQATRAQRLAVADDVIDNSGDESALDDVVTGLHRKYLALAATG